jgi:Na+-driven multidrug efflux pump
MITQCIALPIHSWVAVVNMLCAGLGNAKGALALSTARQGSCFIPILYPLTWIFGAYGIASVQALADTLTLALAIPIAISMTKKIKAAQNQLSQDCR